MKSQNTNTNLSKLTKLTLVFSKRSAVDGRHFELFMQKYAISIMQNYGIPRNPDVYRKHSGKTSAHARVLKNMAANLNYRIQNKNIQFKNQM